MKKITKNITGNILAKREFIKFYAVTQAYEAEQKVLSQLQGK
jgi:hypothetical protein